jgi:serine/threonine protein kinase
VKYDHDPTRLETKLARLIRICERFENDWKDGKSPRIESLLGGAGADDQTSLLRELLFVEVQLRILGGELPTPDEYESRFPGHTALIHSVVSHANFSTRTERNSPSRPKFMSRPVVQSSRYGQLVEIGRGGMGVVYRAFDRRRNEVVALKTIRNADSKLLYRFKAEFRSLAGIVHPNLVQLYELTQEEGTWWFSMEYVDGVNFLEHVRSGYSPGEIPTEADEKAVNQGDRRPITWPSTVESGESLYGAEGERVLIAGGPWVLSAPRIARLRDAFVQLVEGVHWLHGQKRLHRDIKQSNVLVTRDGRVVLLDFGLAAEIAPDGLHQDSEPYILGTLAYMSPEQAAGEPVSPASDFYCLGTMLYESLTSRLPFVGSAYDVIQKKKHTEPPPPSALLPGVPDDLNALCVDLLRRDPAARPSGASVLERLRAQSRAAGDFAGAPAQAERTVLLAGRERHLETLERAFEAVGQGRTTALFVRGRSGVGKTTLVERFLQSVASRPDVVVLSGRCREQEWLPFKAVDGVVDALSRYLKCLPPSRAGELLPRDSAALTRVFPVLLRVGAVIESQAGAPATPDPGTMRRRAFAAFRELLRRLGARRRLVLFMDDMQWGDLDSAALISEFLRGPDPPRLLLLGSYRSEKDSWSPFLQQLLAPDGAASGVDRVDLDVEPLTEAEAEELALELLGGDTPGVSAYARVVAKESQGSPLFVHELVRSAGHSGPPLSARSGVLDDVLWTRIQRLPEASRRVLWVVAVSGRPLSWADATAAAGVYEGKLTALTVLSSGRLVRGAGSQDVDHVEVYHDHVREVIVAHLGPEVLKEHHRRLALRLEESGQADVEDLALHFHEAGEPERAGAYYAAAADRAATSLAFERAVTLYKAALQLLPAGSPDKYQLTARLGDALANARRGREAGLVYLDAAPGVSRVESIDLRRRAFQQLLSAGELDLGSEVMRQVFRDVGLRYAGTPSLALASTLLGALRLQLFGVSFRPRTRERIGKDVILRLDVGWSAGMGLCMIDTARGAHTLFDYLHRSTSAGDVFHSIQSMLAVAAFTAVSGRSGLGLSRRLIELAEGCLASNDDPTLEAVYHMAKGMIAFSQGNWPESLEHNDRGARVQRERCTGVSTSIEVSAFFSLLALFWMGDIGELRRRRRELLLEAEQRGDLFSQTNYRTEVMAYDLLADDDPGGAADEAGDAISRWARQAFHSQHYFALIAAVRVDLYRGDGPEALRKIRDARRDFRRAGLMWSSISRINYTQVSACAALAAWGAGRANGPGLLREASAAAARLGSERLRFTSALAAMFRGRVGMLRGDRDRAVEALRHAEAQFRALQMPLYEAATAYRLGELLPADERDPRTRGAIDLMASRQVKRPLSMIRMILP